MTRKGSVPQSSADLLRYLRDLESRREGFEVRGVRGWARPVDVERETIIYGTAERLRQLSDSGRVTREEVRVQSGVAGAVWVYRITDEGARLIDERDGRGHVPVAAPGALVQNQAYVSSTAAAALEALRHAVENPGRKEWIQGEPEWRTSRELTEWLKAEGDRVDMAPGVFFPGDMMWLVRNHLAERRDDPAVIYRITNSGAALEPLVWHGEPPREI